MKTSRCASNAPATPAKNDDTEKARIFASRTRTAHRVRRDLILADRRAMARPNFEYSRLRSTQIVTTTQKNAHAIVVSFGMPSMPRGPPTYGMFSIADFTIMRKASVMIAR